LSTPIAFAAALALLVTAQARKPKGPHTPPADDRYFVADPNDPRVLHPSPAFRERGFDRGYVEKMTRPPIPKAVLDEIERARPPRAVHLVRPGSGMGNPLAATVIDGSVIVIEGNNDLVVNTESGLGFNHGNGMFDVVNTVLGNLGDQFDFITVWTTFPDFNVAAYYSPLRQDTEGLGECNFNAGRTFGCIFDQTEGFKIQGLVFMNSVSMWQEWDRGYDGVVHPLDDFQSAVYSTLGQEVAHRWGSGLRFVDPRTGNVSNKLLGRDFSHWAAYVDTDASVMDGWDWADEGDGVFDLVNDLDIYSTLDLYTMGALPVASAQPFFFIDEARYQGGGAFGITGPVGAQDALQLPSIALMEENGVNLGATGTRVDVTIQDVADAEGNRCPDPDHTQKTFTQAFVLVTRTGQSAAQAQSDIIQLELIADTWEKWWADRTGNALTLCTNLAGECKQAAATLKGGDVDSPKGGGLIEPGDDVTLHIEVAASGDKLKNARVTIELRGAGADHAEVDEIEKALGDVDEGAEVDVPVQISFDEDLPCGSPTIVVAAIASDNAPIIREEYRLFPGYHQVFLETFGKSDDFEVDNDDASAGGLERIDIALSCDTTKRTPERDATPANAGAYVTGAGTELDGDASLSSPDIDVRGTLKPQLRFNYWLDGDGSLLVELSQDGGDTFHDAAQLDEPAHEWQLGFVEIEEVFGGVPEEVIVRFTFKNRDGPAEGGVDDVRILARAGRCAGIFGLGVCGCSTTGGADPQAVLAALLGLLGARSLLRRRR
jgi:MYXO-CTERM domain-containing protein